MARQAIEERARELNLPEITPDVVQETSRHLNVIPSDNPDLAGEVPVARLVVLKKTKRFAPSFHKHILASKIRGTTVAIGKKILVYEVVQVDPEGPVKVTDSTQLEFR